MRVNPKNLTHRTMPCFQEMLIFLSCLPKFNYDDDKVVNEKNALNKCMELQTMKDKEDAIKFAPIWDAVILSLREEDLINNRERDLLIMPDNRISYTNEGPNLLIHWPLFLLANKVQIAVELAAGYKIGSQNDLWDEIKRDEYMAFAVQEAFQGLETTLLSLLNHDGQHWVERVFRCVKDDLQLGNFVSQFHLSKLRDVLEKTRELTDHLGHDETTERRTKAEAALGVLFEVVRDDFIPNDLRS